MEEIPEEYISGKTENQEIKEIEASSEEIFTESDDANPLHVYYDAENLATIVNEIDITQKDGTTIKPKKRYLRDVRSSSIRHSK